MAVKKQSTKWVLTNTSGSRVLGKHDTKKEALAQLRAIEASKHRKKSK